jgi:dolichol-phosphate mannosyltransferase
LKTLAIIIPVFNEEAVLPELIGRLKSVMDGLDGNASKVVFIDDGSTDATAGILQSAAHEDSRFCWIRFTRNFGLQAALTAGLNEVEADAVVFMDADLQDPPEVIPQMVSRWHDGVEVVLAERCSRTESGLRGLMIRAFHVLMPHFTGNLNMRNSGNFGLLSKKALMALRQLPERNRYYPGLRSWIGFRCESVSYDRESRQAGAPKQTFRRLLLYASDALFSFSYLPLRLLTGIGILISAGGFTLGLYFTVKRLLGLESAFTGFTTLVILVVCLGGFQLIALGVIGEYLLRIYDEVKGRPPYLIESRSDPKDA